MITIKSLKKDEEVQTLIKYTDAQLENLGYTEHSTRHVSIVSNWAKDIIEMSGGNEREMMLAELAGYLHDIGNAINRSQHAQNGAALAYHLLTSRGMPYADACEIMAAIGNHDEQEGKPSSRLAAALIIADKADVHRSRVRFNKRTAKLAIGDIHDRVNYAVESSHLEFEGNEIKLNIVIDTKLCPVIDYFEIYFSRMKLCRQAAKVLGMEFVLIINNAKMI
ncbi:MAG: HD domain-containing protein [Clostridia bacterium]